MNFKLKSAFDIVWLGLALLVLFSRFANINEVFTTFSDYIDLPLLVLSPLVIVPKILEMRHKKISWLDIIIIIGMIFSFSILLFSIHILYLLATA